MKTYFTSGFQKIITVILLSACFYTCTNQIEEIANTKSLQGDPIDPAFQAILETIPTDYHSLEDALLPSGVTVTEFLKDHPELDAELKKGGRLGIKKVGPQAWKDFVIARMLTTSEELTKPQDIVSEGEDSPQQPYGLAYSYGQRDHSTRQFPPKDPSCKRFKIKGLDCSGLMYQLLKGAGLAAETGWISHDYGNTNKWKTLLEKEEQFDRVVVKDLGKIPSTDFKSGDVIYWSGPGHVGLVLQFKGRNANNTTPKSAFSICQSNGNIGQCESNYNNSKKGVRQMSFAELSYPSWNNYKILRINTKAAGKWIVNIKCDWASAPAITMDIKFPEVEDGQVFTAEGTGTDYDNSPLICMFQGTYNSANEILEGSFFTWDDNNSNVREDYIKIKLSDKTEYVRMESRQRDPDSCLGDVQFITDTEKEGGRRVAKNINLTKQNFLFNKKP